MRVRACQALFQLRHLQDIPLIDQTTELTHECDMFRDIARQLPELGVILHEPLHVRDRLDVHIGLCFCLVLVDIALDIGAQIPQVQEHVLLEICILITRQHNFL